MGNAKRFLQDTKIGLVFFALAIVTSFRFSARFSVDQSARNQAQAQENGLRGLERPGDLIQDQDSENLRGIREAVSKALEHVG
jgi:hypothetical protein